MPKAEPVTANAEVPDRCAPQMSALDAEFAMAALTMAMFVALLSNLVVLNAMPRISADLGASQADYTWIITSSMLTIAICTPVWGRLSDMVNGKLLIQLCVFGYVGFSAIASMAMAPWVIIACRIGIGVCASGMIVLMQTISANIMSPRRRAQWIGYRAAAMSVATLGGPSFGGLITETFGWRACFLVGIPLAAIAIAMLQKTLRLPEAKKQALEIDWIGTIFLAIGIVATMLWVSIFGPEQGFFTGFPLVVLTIGLVSLIITFAVELRVPKPILALGLFRKPEIRWCTLASAGVGVAMFGSAVFLAPYLQIAQGLSPSIAGLMALPEAAGGLSASIMTARLVSRSGRYRILMIAGAAFQVVGFGLLATIGRETSLVLIGIYTLLIGIGLGILGETMVIIVQNAVRQLEVGAAGALVAFTRMLGGVLGVAVLGVVLASQIDSSMVEHGIATAGSDSLSQISRLSAAAQDMLRSAYADGIALLYLCCVPIACVVLVCMVKLPERLLEGDSNR